MEGTVPYPWVPVCAGVPQPTPYTQQPHQVLQPVSSDCRVPTGLKPSQQDIPTRVPVPPVNPSFPGGRQSRWEGEDSPLQPPAPTSPRLISAQPAMGWHLSTATAGTAPALGRGRASGVQDQEGGKEKCRRPQFWPKAPCKQHAFG